MSSKAYTAALGLLKSQLTSIDPTGALAGTASGVFTVLKTLIAARKVDVAAGKAVDDFNKANITDFTKGTTEATDFDVRNQVASIFNMELTNKVSDVKVMIDRILGLLKKNKGNELRTETDSGKQQALAKKRDDEARELDIGEEAADEAINALV